MRVAGPSLLMITRAFHWIAKCAQAGQHATANHSLTKDFWVHWAVGTRSRHRTGTSLQPKDVNLASASHMLFLTQQQVLPPGRKPCSVPPAPSRQAAHLEEAEHKSAALDSLGRHLGNC